MENKKQRYIIGVSGGPDSMCLLDKYKNKILAVCHVNYNMRSSAKRDANIVKTYCKKNKIDLYIKNINSKKHNYTNFQAWAREIRYNFMFEICKKYNCNNILIAHNLNDFLETAIMQLRKKKDVLFLGIRKITYIKDFVIYRPLINKWKNDLQKYCNQKNITYGIDESNFDKKYNRNAIRYEISKWSIKKINDTLNRIKEFNNKNKFIDKKTKDFYNNWKKNFYIKELFFSNKSDKFIFHVLYLMFVEYNLKFSKNKFEMIMKFVNKNNPNKIMRISNDKKIFVKNWKLFFI